MIHHDDASGSHDESSRIALPMMAARVDLLSQMLMTVSLSGELVFSAAVSTPWSLGFDPGLTWFHIVTEGEAELSCEGEPPVHASAGDLIILPKGGRHTLSAGDARPVLVNDLLARRPSRDQLAIEHGGGGAPSHLICGAFRFSAESLHGLAESLPSIIHITRDNRSDEPGWLEGLAHFLLAEARTPSAGAALMISRMIDVLVIRALRTWVQTAPGISRGWLGAMADVRISRTLKALHDDPFRRWSVAELAEVAGMSRSSFAERFTTLVGETPLRYQNHWRLAVASRLLQQGEVRVNEAARHVGYDSETTFSRAFKAMFGYSPIHARERANRGAL